MNRRHFLLAAPAAVALAPEAAMAAQQPATIFSLGSSTVTIQGRIGSDPIPVGRTTGWTSGLMTVRPGDRIDIRQKFLNGETITEWRVNRV